MNLSKETIAIIKNFSTINNNLLFREGSVITTISSQRNIMASVTAQETFPLDFGIYDLNEFLGAYTLFNNPDLEFTSKFVTISGGNNQIKYYAADASVLTVPTKTVNFPEADITFDLTEETLGIIKRTASILRTNDLSIISEDSTIVLRVGDKKNATGNSYQTVLGGTSKIFDIKLKTDNLKLISGDYKVSISNKKISRFESTTSDLTYFIAVESDSIFSPT